MWRSSLLIFKARPGLLFPQTVLCVSKLLVARRIATKVWKLLVEAFSKVGSTSISQIQSSSRRAVPKLDSNALLTGAHSKDRIV
jgi:hypothetical protein